MDKQSLTVSELMDLMFGSNQYIVQKRSHMHCVFTFDSIDDAKRKLHELSHDPDTTFVYYNGDVLTSCQFTEIYGGYEYVPDVKPDDASNDSYEKKQDQGEDGGCSNGCCSIG